MAKIGLWVSQGCMFSSVTMLLDTFAIANLWHKTLTKKESPALFEALILTTDGLPVTAYGGIRIQPDRAVGQVEQADCIVISPFLPNVTPMPANLDILFQWIKTMRQQGTSIASVCTGTFILAEMGLLDGKKATTNWQYARMFMARYPKVRLTPEEVMTEDDGFICTGAATAVYYLGLHFIKQFGSQKLASVCSKALLVDPNRGSQAPYSIFVPIKHHGDTQVLKAQQLIEKNYAKINAIDAVAGAVGISPRHFKRRFKHATSELPLKYLQRVRIDAAKEKLETTKDSIDEITWAVGYQDISSFSRLFKQHTQISPRAYRDKFFSPAPK